MSGDGLGEADAVAAGLADVGVVHEPVDGGGGQGFRHELVESGGVEVGADRDAAALVGGVDDPVEALGGVGADGQQRDVVDDDEVGPQDAGDGLGDGGVGAVRADLVVVDDIGLLPVGPDAAEGLYRLVDAAYERRSVAVSSNLHPSAFDELMPKTLATATVDRLMHHAHLCQTSGDSIRLTQAIAGKGVIPLN